MVGIWLVLCLLVGIYLLCPSILRVQTGEGLGDILHRAWKNKQKSVSPPASIEKNPSCSCQCERKLQGRSNRLTVMGKPLFSSEDAALINHALSKFQTSEQLGVSEVRSVHWKVDMWKDIQGNLVLRFSPHIY